jgi:dihydrolipoamide dehydrogenase
MEVFDVVVIGSGPGGYVAAIKAAQLGLKTAIAEKDPTFGGTCLNVGCIPTKAMIHSAELYAHMAHLADHGIVVEGYRFDMGKMHQRKDKVVAGLTKGVAFLLKKNNVTTFQGRGSFEGAHAIRIESADGSGQTVEARHVIVATGSEPKQLPHIRFDGRVVLSSTDMLRLPDPPKTLAVIGAGAVGVEFASIYAALGTDVTVIEMLPHLLPLEDEEVSAELEKAFKKRKIRFQTGALVEALKTGPDGAVLSVKDAAGKVKEAAFEKVLLAVGRAPYTAGLGLEKAGLETARGFIPVDAYCRTGVPHIYAIGDVIDTPQLAHVGSAEGILAARHIAGRHVQPINYRNVPACTYSAPQVASTGLTEKKARELHADVKVGKFPFSGIGKTRIEDMTEGFIKIVTEAKTGEILGVHMIGAIATELVAETVLALHLECTAEELAAAIHPHPTISEAMMEAAHAAHDAAIHM